jgi:hypothetical protein
VNKPVPDADCGAVSSDLLVTQLERNRAPEGEPVASWWFYRDWRVHFIIPASGLRLR